ncbi:MAG: ATP-binding cassette domain-containing protein [Desulfatiglans sp.]|jgi:putative ABC transport system ATP-binding protein|nr:ATP-binding cassette domain-containing protein [Thermodesulfobacteriota bacterium]MEE4353597.1 ATP-binding cassette domain-containing protein [Desulfatiglans sp.]
MATLTLKKIARDFSDGRQVRRVLFPTDLDFAPGELTVLSGPSGSGKTTLLSIMGLVLRPSEGRMFLDEHEVTALSDQEAAAIRLKYYGFVFQQPMLIEGLSVAENILLAFAVQGDRLPPDARQKTATFLKTLGLEGTAYMQPRLLSGGMKQRTSIARALIKDPAILLCDEPTSALDAESGQAVMRILKGIAVDEGRVVVVVSHDARVFPYADRLFTLENGTIVSDIRENYIPEKGDAP